MSGRSGFLEGLIIGAVLGGISVLLASPNSRRDIQSKIRQFRDENDDFVEAAKESTEDLIQKTKQSIENGFDRLTEIIHENKRFIDESVPSTNKK